MTRPTAICLMSATSLSVAAIFLNTITPPKVQIRLDSDDSILLIHTYVKCELNGVFVERTEGGGVLKKETSDMYHSLLCKEFYAMLIVKNQ